MLCRPWKLLTKCVSCGKLHIGFDISFRWQCCVLRIKLKCLNISENFQWFSPLSETYNGNRFDENWFLEQLSPTSCAQTAVKLWCNCISWPWNIILELSMEIRPVYSFTVYTKQLTFNRKLELCLNVYLALSPHYTNQQQGKNTLCTKC